MTPTTTTHVRVYTHFHLFCGIGGGALGFHRASARVGTLEGRFRCLGGIDADTQAVADFTRLVGVPATCLDLFNETQYRAFHGKAPPPGWTEATHHDIREAAQWETPDVVFLSPPCKGLSGLLSKKSAKSARYQALNQLVPRGVHLMMEAWGDDPPALILIENVPRIQQRGRALLDEVIGILDAAGYSVAETTHDCGELGGLAQHRRRFLLVARHRAKVPAFLYEPPRKRVRGVGEVLGDMPLPDHGLGPMHECPRLQFRTWARLAMIEAGKDWRCLEGMDWERYAIVPSGHPLFHPVPPPPANLGRHSGKMRVEPFDAPSHTITGSDRVGSGALSVADPRCHDANWRSDVMGVRGWDEASGAVTTRSGPTNGRFTVADPRLPSGRFNNVYRLVRWDEPSPTVTCGGSPSAGGVSVADPRPPRDLGTYQPYGVVRWDEPGRTVTGQSAPGGGAYSVADPRVGSKRRSQNYRGAGHYGVLSWEESAKAVTAHHSHDNSWGSVADPRLPAPTDRPDPVPVIVALDGTYHRPFTTMELGALQGFRWQDFVLEGNSHSRWRQGIGNAVPVDAAEAVGSTMLHTLLLSETERSFCLSSLPIWVRPMAIGLSMERPRPTP